MLIKSLKLYGAWTSVTSDHQSLGDQMGAYLLQSTILSTGLIVKNKKTPPADQVAIVRVDASITETLHAMIERQSQIAIVIDDEKIIGTVAMQDLRPLAARIALQTERQLRSTIEMLEQNVTLALAASESVHQQIRHAYSLLMAEDHPCAQSLRSVDETMTAFRETLQPQLETDTVKEDVDIATFLTKLASTLHQSARERGVVLNVTSMPEAIIRAQTQMLGQTLRHLIQGAINRSPEGSVITIHGTLELRAHDRGQRKIARIRSHVSTPASSMLMQPESPIARQIITTLVHDLRRHHEGLLFTLPKDSDIIFELGVPMMKISQKQPENFAAAKVLIVEDDPDILDMLEDIVKEKGFQTILAHNGEEALELFKKEQPRLVMADIRMPILDGIALAEAIKTINPQTPVILISGQYPNLMIDKLDNKLHCDHVLYKPFARADLIESLYLFLSEQVPK
jgi:CheY-like chemotaxis protein